MARPASGQVVIRQGKQGKTFALRFRAYGERQYVTLGSDTEGWTGEWLGAETFFSSYPAETNSRLVREAGFAIEREEVVTFDEPEGPARFQWVLARR